MLKKIIKYTDLNGERQEVELYFHLTEAELVTLEVTYEPSLTEHLTRMTEETDGAHILKVYKDIIRESFGEKFEDGQGFRKDPQKTKRFMQSLAFSALYIELMTDAKLADAFIYGILPREVAEEARRKQLVDAKKKST